VDADLPVVAPKPMDRLISEATAATSFAMMILLVAGLTALFLGAIGVYGVVSHWVNERARELSIRVAIGAEPADVTRTVLARGLGTVAIGIGMGLVASLALAPVMEALLFGVTASDPVTFAGAGSVLLLAAVVAMIGPTRRALGSDPMTVLRTE
jgi:putative ABC transport system permease protein